MHYKEEELKSNIKFFNLNNRFNNYKSFMDYLNNMDEDKRNEMIFFLYMYNQKYKNEFRNKSLDLLNDMYNILLNKLKYAKLDNKEQKLYEHINSFLISYNIFKPDDLFYKYCNDYLSNLYVDNINEKLILVAYDIINELNKKYNINVKLDIRNDIHVYGNADWLNNILEHTISINIDLYKKNNLNAVKNDKDILIIYISYFILILLHEYRHILQKIYFYKNNDLISKEYENSILVLDLYKDMYKKYHDCFEIEKDANRFSYDNVIMYTKKYLKRVDFDTMRDKIIGYLKTLKKTYSIEEEKCFLKKYRRYIKIMELKSKLGLESEKAYNLKKRIIYGKNIFSNGSV